LERLFDLPPESRTLEEATALVAPEWEKALADDPELGQLFGDPAQIGDWLGSTQTLLAGYFALEDPRRLEPAEREACVETLLDNGLRLRGYVDRLDVAASGALRVVDYKTGRPPGEGYEAKAMFQLKFYALVLWRTRGVLPAELRLYYLGEREVLRYAPAEHELAAFERLLRALWQAIERATTNGDFRPRRSRLCDWCEHHSRCPEWGGTLPPWPPEPADGAQPAR
jgi:putative RecB family exonuclease